MTKLEFMSALSRELTGFPPAEVSKLMEYYEELFADGMEAGQTEEDICAGLDTPFEIAERVRIELAFVRAKQKPSPKALNAVLLIVLGIFALPIGLPLAISLVAVLFAVFMVVISLIGTAVIVALSIGISGIAALCAGVYAMFTGFFLFGLSLVGVSLILIGLGLMGTLGFIYLIRLVFRGIVRMFHGIYNSIGKRKRGQTA